MQLIEKTIKTKLTDNAKFYGYVLDNSPEMDINRRRPAILIIPGGGYAMTSDREAEPVAIKMLSKGYQAFILRYNVAPVRYPAALLEIASSVKLIRDNAEAWHVDPDKIILAGFSAGGHLAANLATAWNGQLLQGYGYKREDIQPNGLMLGYSVITSGKYAHVDSFKNLLGDDYNNEVIRESVSLEKQVTAATPRTFLWHTYTDDCVPVENSLLFADALKKANVPLEMHIFPQGGHGLSLGTAETAIAENGYGIQTDLSVWPDLFATWVNNSFNK
ncbi:alpha/beta hydrolase [Lapidilactobacillus gannanensis]|uniref:Alpha/beta hydrolase n=1 Tax=Lapidilactobacillus gannanensis TaxID=2486002 RepID=A0ABW4BKW5_9LACO|nr:alpha/beta hydrolase [Lapidilactobacillus gannanensis]MCH4057997.1 alpha/beta hydrolase [Lactobacillaceae bacterium]